MRQQDPTAESINKGDNTQQNVPLSQHKKQEITAQAFQDLIDVINLLFLPDLGCIHLRSEWYLHRGILEALPSHWPNNDNPNYVDKCYVCKGTYKRYMLPIVYSGAIEFLDSDYFSGSHTMPYVITLDDGGKITNKLWDSLDWRKKVFGVKTVEKYNVNCFFFQLIAAGLLTFQWTNAKGEVLCVFGKDNKDRIKYKFIHNWKGFTFRNNSHSWLKITRSPCSPGRPGLR